VRSGGQRNAWRARAVGNGFGMGLTLITLGYLAQHQGNLARARALLAESLAYVREVRDTHSIALCVAALAGVAGRKGLVERAVRLFAAVQAVFEQLKAVPGRAHRIEIEHNVAAARAQLDDAAFTAAWAEGRAMSLEQAIDDALDARGDAAGEGALAPDDAGQGGGWSPARPTARLTAREVAVLTVVAEGATDQEIAARLGLRPRTVTTYLTSIYAKLAVRTRTAAVRVAREQDLI
jgi:DNA-binding CsgD family transcriptional regulator